MSRHLSWFTLAALVVPASAAAQRLHPLVGHEARVAYRCAKGNWRPGLCRDEGIVLGTEGDTLRLTLAGDTGRAIAKTSVARVWVRDGRGSHLWAGLGWGLLGGALLGTVIGATQEFCIFTCSSAAPIGFILGAPAGMLIGSVVGAAIRTDRWRRVEADGIGVGLRATSRGVGVGVAVEF